MKPFRKGGPGNGGKWQISSEGGMYPMWSLTSRELFYLNSRSQIAVAGYSASDSTFTPGKPLLWLDKRLISVGFTRSFDLAPDGKRFAVFKATPDAVGQRPHTQVTYLLNFFGGIRRRIPPGSTTE